MASAVVGKPGYPLGLPPHLVHGASSVGFLFAFCYLAPACLYSSRVFRKRSCNGRLPASTTGTKPAPLPKKSNADSDFFAPATQVEMWGPHDLESPNLNRRSWCASHLCLEPNCQGRLDHHQ